LNNFFFHRYGFSDFHGGGFEGRGVWAHDPAHRLGVPYSNSALSNRYRGTAGARTAGGNFGSRGAAQGQRSGNPGFEQRSSGANHSAFGGVQGRSQTRQQSDHGYSSLGARRTQPSNSRVSAQNDNVLFAQSRNVLLTPSRLGGWNKDYY
jgi:hypothetical protein